MFSGIIAAVGKVQDIAPRASGLRLTIHAGGLDLSDVILGDSIACNGVCLTVVDLLPATEPTAFVVDVSDETLRCTTGLMANAPLNLEKALRLADRLGGHLVTGHVDGIGTIRSVQQRSASWWVGIKIPPQLMKYCIPVGSVAVDGISLTVAEIKNEMIYVSIIPHTWDHTVLSIKKTGDEVNIETDMIGKYVEKFFSANKQEQTKPLTEARLKELGY